MKKLMSVAMFVSMLLACASAFGQETPEQRAGRLTEYWTNSGKIQAQAVAYKGIYNPEVEAAKTFSKQGDGTPGAQAPAGADVLIWTSYETVMTGYVPGNNGIVRSLGLFKYSPNTGFNLVAPVVGDPRSTVFVTGDGFEGTLFLLADPQGIGQATEYFTYDGVKSLDALLPFSSTNLVGNTAYGHNLLAITVSNSGVSIPPSQQLKFIGNGSTSLAMNSRGDIVSLDIRQGLIWILRKGQSPDILYSQSDLRSAVAVAYDMATDQLYVLAAVQKGETPLPSVGPVNRATQNYQPGRIVRLTDNGFGRQQATLTEVASGGFLDNIQYGPNSLAVSDGRIYFTANDYQGGREVLMWDTKSKFLQLTIPSALARGVPSFALLSSGSSPFPTQQ